jgi:short-subunit dehydrogenase
MSTTLKWALITGASEGIGYELARLFARNRYNLIMVALTEDKLNSAATRLKEEFGIEVINIAKDLSRWAAPFEVYDQIKAKGITVDVLVNNAAQGQYGEFVDTDIERELAMVRLNIGAYLTFTKLFLKEMTMRNEGKILQVSSIAGEVPGPLQAVYHGTKAFITSFTEAIQEENKFSNVTITYLMPGATDTDFFNKADMENSKMVQEGNLADPAKVAQDGYEALMAGDRNVVSGLKNKAMVAAAKVMPDRLSAKAMHKQMEPSDKTDKKEKE